MCQQTWLFIIVFLYKVKILSAFSLLSFFCFLLFYSFLHVCLHSFGMFALHFTKVLTSIPIYISVINECWMDSNTSSWHMMHSHLNWWLCCCDARLGPLVPLLFHFLNFEWHDEWSFMKIDVFLVWLCTYALTSPSHLSSQLTLHSYFMYDHESECIIIL